MECKKHKPFVIMPKTKPKPRKKAKTRVEGKGLTKTTEKKKTDIIYARGYVKLSKSN